MPEIVTVIIEFIKKMKNNFLLIVTDKIFILLLILFEMHLDDSEEVLCFCSN